MYVLHNGRNAAEILGVSVECDRPRKTRVELTESFTTAWISSSVQVSNDSGPSPAKALSSAEIRLESISWMILGVVKVRWDQVMK